MTPNTTAAAPTTGPTQQDHAKLVSFLAILEKLGMVALALAPAIAAPFVKNPGSIAILQEETPIAESVAQALAS